jgi:hypothetical protein
VIERRRLSRNRLDDAWMAMTVNRRCDILAVFRCQRAVPSRNGQYFSREQVAQALPF